MDCVVSVDKAVVSSSVDSSVVSASVDVIRVVIGSAFCVVVPEIVKTKYQWLINSVKIFGTLSMVYVVTVDY